MTSMRILFWAPGFYQVGDHFRCLQFAHGLSARGHDVTCLLGSRQLSLRFRRRRGDGFTVVHPPYIGELGVGERIWQCQPDTKLPFDVLARSLWVAAQGSEYDVIHSFHIGASSLLPFVVAQRTSKRTVCIQDWCDLWTGGILRPPNGGTFARFDHWSSTTVESLHIRRATALTVNNSYLAEKAIREHGLSPARILKAVEGADTQTIVPRDKTECRRALGLRSDAVWVGFSAFFNPDTTLLLETFRLLSPPGASPEIRLLWIGPISDETTRAIAAAGLLGAIACVGPVDRAELGRYLGACDLLVLPLSARPVNLGRWPAKLGDYLAAGRPVITNSTGDVADFFRRHPGMGFATAPEAEAFAEAILHLAAHPELRDTFGTTARTVAETALRTADVVQSLETFYRSLQ